MFFTGAITLSGTVGPSNDFLDFPKLLEADSATLPITSSSDYNTWLPKWLQLIASCPTSVHVPPEACSIITPLLSTEWRSLLAEHPHPELVQFFTSSISNGFRIGFRPPQSYAKQARKNMESAYAHREVVDNYLQAENHCSQSCWSIFSLSGPKWSD